MRQRLRILSLEDDPRDTELIQGLLETEGIACEVTRVDTQPAFSASLEGDRFDLILADYTLPSFDGLSALKLATSAHSDVPFIFVSGTLGEEVAIEALKVGATDYVLKTRLSRLAPSILRALREATERAERKRTEKSLRQSEAYLAEAQRISHTGSFGWRPLTGEILWSEETFRIFQYEPRTKPTVELILQRVHPEDAALVQRTIERAAQDGKEIGEMISLMSSEAIRHNISVWTELAEDLPQVMADRVQLQQVLMNLMINGIDAMKDMNGGRELAIKSQRVDNEQLLVSVSDTGVGLPRQQADQIFNAFFTTKPHGTGLELRISRSIVESHGGRLWATANSPHGANFHFTLSANAQAP